MKRYVIKQCYESEDYLINTFYVYGRNCRLLSGNEIPPKDLLENYGYSLFVEAKMGLITLKQRTKYKQTLHQEPWKISYSIELVEI